MRRHAFISRNQRTAVLLLLCLTLFALNSSKHFALCRFLDHHSPAAPPDSCCHPAQTVTAPACHSSADATAPVGEEPAPAPCQCQLEAPPFDSNKPAQVYLPNNILANSVASHVSGYTVTLAGHEFHALPFQPSPPTPPERCRLSDVILI
jgi:hypothetical protein